jgi:hypothetical protein
MSEYDDSFWLDDFDEREIEYNYLDFNHKVTETEKAVLLNTNKGDVWLPKSQITFEDNVVIYPDYVTVKFIKNKSNPFKPVGE